MVSFGSLAGFWKIVLKKTLKFANSITIKVDLEVI